jgi:glyoxylase I family protein
MDNNFIAIHHTSFIISDIERAKHFYHDLLGLPISKARPDFSFDGLWLVINDHQQIHLMQLDNPDPLERPSHGGRDRHTAFKVRDLSLIQMHLDENKIAYTISQSGRQALFCRDPDGNTLEIME